MQKIDYELLTEREAAKFLRLAPISLWRLRRKGELPHVRLASKLLYRRADLIAFIERNARNAEVSR